MPARSPGIAGKRYRVYSGACRGFAMQVFLLALWTSMILLNYSEASKQVLVTLADGDVLAKGDGPCRRPCRSWLCSTHEKTSAADVRAGRAWGRPLHCRSPRPGTRRHYPRRRRARLEGPTYEP